MIVPIVIARSNSFSLQNWSIAPLPHCDALTCPDGTPCSRWAAQRRCPPTLLAPQPGDRTLRNQFDFPAGFFQCVIRLTWSHIFLLAFFLARIRALDYIYLLRIFLYCAIVFYFFQFLSRPYWDGWSRWCTGSTELLLRQLGPGLFLLSLLLPPWLKQLCTLYRICFAKIQPALGKTVASASCLQ